MNTQAEVAETFLEPVSHLAPPARRWVATLTVSVSAVTEAEARKKMEELAEAIPFDSVDRAEVRWVPSREE